MNFYIWSVFSIVVSESCLAAHDTNNFFWEILTWCLFWLWIGLWPNVDWNGNPWTNPIDIDRQLKPLAGGPTDFLFGCVWGLVHDLEFYFKELLLNHFNVKLDPCFCCPATCGIGPMNVNDFRDGLAPWMLEIITKAQWATSPYNRHAIWNIPGVTLLTATVDLMHCKHLGTDQYFYASVLVVLCYYLLPGTPEQNLEIVFRGIRDHYGNTPSTNRYTNLQLCMFCNAENHEISMPCLKGRAAEVKHIGAPLLHVFREHKHNRSAMVPPTQILQIEIALRSSARVDLIMEENRSVIKLPREAYTEFRKVGFDFLVCFNALGHYYSEEHTPAIRLFNVTTKAHYLAHVILQGEFINPRLGWCYAGEHLMFHARRLMQKCMAHNTPGKATVKFAKQYRLGMHLTFERMR